MSHFTSFLWSSLLLTLPIFLFLGGKRMFRSHLTIQGHAGSWYLFFFLLSLPLLPVSWLQTAVRRSFSITTPFGKPKQTVPTLAAAAPLSVNRKIVDFSLSLERGTVFPLSRILFLIWLIGIAVALAFVLLGLFQMKRLTQRAIQVTPRQEPELFSLFEQSRQKLHLKKRILLYRSQEISSPVSYGLLQPKVLIPEDLDIVFSHREVFYICLHELAHHKRRDALLNTLKCFFQILYWFHPAVWYGLKNLASDREMACDSLVLDTIGTASSLEYGQTLLLYAGKRGASLFSSASGIGGSHTQLRKRILQIVNYKASCASQKIKSALILFLVFLLILAGSPFLTRKTLALEAYGKGQTQENTSSSAKTAFATESDHFILEEDLSSYFKDVDGTFVLYDMNENSYRIYNEKQSRERFSPASTYKIYSGLFALEEHIITPEKSQMGWDGAFWPFDTWNQNQDLTSAMQNSVNWYFQNLDQELGIQKLTAYYQKIRYGNCDLSDGIHQYWEEASLQISPMEQVKLLASLYQNTWGFDAENIQAIKAAMLISSQNGCSLYGKTGTGRIQEKDQNGWFVGIVENQEKTWCFALHLQGKDHAGGAKASSIALEILTAKGIYGETSSK